MPSKPWNAGAAVKLDLVFFDAGGGHRSAANALRLAIEQRGLPWELRLINLQEILDSIDLFRQITGVRLEDVYNLLLKKGWTLGSGAMLQVMHGLIRLYHPLQVRLLEKFWKANPPDIVVSVVPNFNRAMFQALRRVSATTPYVTILTDLADYPPHFWIERQAQYLICGTEKAVGQARAQGYPEERVFRTSGMILHPRFYDLVMIDRRSERARLGLDPDVPTGLVMFGGQGSGVMRDIARRLAESPHPLQLILICGRNEKLANALRRIRGARPMWVEGFTTEVPYYMHLADFFVGKPGPASISEALAMGLPVIVERNAWTLPQERYNADWVRERHVGVVVESFREIDRAVGDLLRPENLARFRANAAAIKNRAVFEIPELLEQILAREGVAT